MNIDHHHEYHLGRVRFCSCSPAKRSLLLGKRMDQLLIILNIVTSDHPLKSLFMLKAAPGEESIYWRRKLGSPRGPLELDMS